MTIEWRRNPHDGRNAAHALIDGSWGCRYAKGAKLGEVVPTSNVGLLLQRVCAYCAARIEKTQ